MCLSTRQQSPYKNQSNYSFSPQITRLAPRFVPLSSSRSCSQFFTLIVIIFRVGRLVVLLIEAVQVGDLLQQLEDAVPVILQVRDLTVEQVKALQVLEILLKINPKEVFPPFPDCGT